MTCGSCASLAGRRVLTNAPRLVLDDHWIVEHAHPVAVPGWLVLVLRRHARALHDLTDAEAAGLGRWLPALARALHAATGCELEYVAQFAEGAGFHHVHVHLVARAPEWPDDLRGPRVFAALSTSDPVGAAEATRIVEAVGAGLGVRPEPVAGVVVAADDPRAGDVRALLERHLAFAHEVTPAGHVHALDLDALLDPAVSFYAARRGGTLLGVGALKRLGGDHAEIKSMHTAAEARGQGVGRALLDHLLAVAADSGHRRVSLETGTMPVFAAARSLYASAGFVPCEPFGPYTVNPYSTCMTLTLPRP